MLNAELKYTIFIDKQLELTSAMNDNNLSESAIKDILIVQKNSYRNALETMMSDKERFIKNINTYDDDIFSLEKIIKINKRAGNSFAVLRDEVQVKSYKLLNNQNKMISDILKSIDDKEDLEFKENLTKHIQNNIALMGPSP